MTIFYLLFWAVVIWILLSVQFCSVAQSCLTLCNPMNHSTKSLPVHHKLPESTQIHVHRVIQPFHLLSSPSPPAPNPFQHQGLFQWVNLSHEVAKDWRFSFSINPSNEYSLLISFRIDWFNLVEVQETQVSSPTPKFKSINSSALSFLHSPTLTSIHDHWKNHSLDETDLCWQCNVSAF